jgi:hypothetical protein
VSAPGIEDATMLYAIKLGPMETEDGPMSAYVGFTETGALRPVLALKDSDGRNRRRLRCRVRSGAASGFGRQTATDRRGRVVDARSGIARHCWSGPGQARVGM